MIRSANPIYTERNKNLVTRYEAGETAKALAAESGLTQIRLRRILVLANCTIRPEPRGKRCDIRRRDNAMASLGAKLQAERAKRGLTPAMFAIQLGMSVQNLNAAMQGLYDWKWSEIVRITKALNRDFHQLTKPPDGMRS